MLNRRIAAGQSRFVAIRRHGPVRSEKPENPDETARSHAAFAQEGVRQ
jgi:hypothetical protein